MEKDILNYLPTGMFRGTHCRLNKVSLTYKRYTPSGCKNIRIITRFRYRRNGKNKTIFLNILNVNFFCPTF